MDSLSQSSSAFLLDVDLFVCVGLQVLQPVRLSVHYLVRGFHESVAQTRQVQQIIQNPVFFCFIDDSKSK